MIMAATQAASGFAVEYEVDGKLSQTIVPFNGTNLQASASFTVYVRDCGWLIQTTETNEIGTVYKREVGSTNGNEIYECVFLLQAPPPRKRLSTNGIAPQTRPPRSGRLTNAPSIATIIATNIPVGQMDDAVVGHLWLMFASQCYWPILKTDRLTPVYDWHASVAAGSRLAERAEWDLLNGSGSLPREVRYLGQWDETNALYRANGVTSAGQTPITDGFVFEERHAVQFKGMVLRKRVDVEVTAVRPVCTRASLLPSPDAMTMVIDRRVDGGAPTIRPPAYPNPVSGQWAPLEEAKKLAEVRSNAVAAALEGIRLRHHTSRRTPFVVAFMCCMMLGPLGIYFVWKRSGKRAEKS